MKSTMNQINMGAITGAYVNIDHNKPYSKWVTITPDLARSFLKRNRVNRNIRKNWVLDIANDIRTGRFENDNGESIKFDTNGDLNDGQHRLIAIIKAGQDVDYLITFNVRPNGLCDVPTKRSPKDKFKNSGMKYYGQIQSAINLIVTVKYRRAFFKAITPAENIEFGLENKDRLQFWAEKCKGGNTIISDSMLIALAFIGSMTYEQDMEMFIKSVVHGIGLDFGDPVLALRNILERDSKQTNKISRENRFAYLIAAWNHRVSRNKIKKLVLPQKEYKFKIMGGKPPYA